MKQALLRAIGMGLALSALSGCAEDVMTYSRDFKREGYREYNSGDYLDAAGSFAAAAKQDPTDYRTQYYLGLSYEKCGEPQKATEAYELSLKLRPMTPAGRQDVAMRERAMNRLASLIAHADFADPEINALGQEASDDKSPDEYRLLARVFAIRGDADTAVADYRIAVSYAPDDFEVNKEYGLYLYKMGQTTDATAVLKKAWQEYDGDAQVAEALRSMGVVDKELVVSNSHIEHDSTPTTPDASFDPNSPPRD